MAICKRNRVGDTPAVAAPKPEEVRINPISMPWTISFSILGLVMVVQALSFMLAFLINRNPQDLAPEGVQLDLSGSDFSVTNAYAHLEAITRQPHHFNMRANDDVRNYILSYAQGIRANINNKVQVVDDDSRIAFLGQDTPTAMFGTSNVTGYLVSGNVLVRIRGTENTGNALLISAHFDSVQLSYGANDNGMGVVAAMEMLRLAAMNPPKHDLIFNFNNHEEAGVLGSVAFMAHEWASTVRAFINLEGAGSGGRVLLFQCSNPRLVELARAIPRPSTSVLGNDLFQMRIINSVTDFAVYSGRHAIPGVDFAIVNNRAIYHTHLDNIQHAYMTTLLSMGQSLWPFAQAIDQSDFLETQPKVESSGIFYTLFSFFSFHYSFAVDHILGIVVMVLMIATIVLYTSFPRCQRGLIPDGWGACFNLPLKALASSLSGLILFGLISFGMNSLIVKKNVLAVHRYWMLVYGMDMLLAAICFILVDWAFKRNKPCHKRFQAATTSMLAIWLLIMVGQRITGFMQVGLLYFMTWFVYAFLCSFIVSLVVDPINYWTETPGPNRSRKCDAVFLAIQVTVMVFVPCLLLHDSVSNVMASMSQSLITGTKPVLVYSFLSGFGAVAILPCIPFFALAGRPKWTLPFLALLWAILLTTTLLITPLSPQDPTTLFWGQSYDLATGESPVTVKSVFDLADAAPALLKASARDPTNFKIIPSSPLAMLTFDGIPPTFDIPHQNLINLTIIQTSSKFTNISLEAHDTKKCRIAIPTQHNLTSLIVNQLSMSTSTSAPLMSPSNFGSSLVPEPSHLIYLMRSKFNQDPWSIKLHYQSPPQTIFVSCFYDEYDLHVPALANLQKDPNLLPPTIALSTMAHILEVKQKFSL